MLKKFSDDDLNYRIICQFSDIERTIVEKLKNQDLSDEKLVLKFS